MRKGAGLAACLPLWMLTSWPAGHIYISVEEKKNGQEINKSFLNARKKKSCLYSCALRDKINLALCSLSSAGSASLSTPWQAAVLLLPEPLSSPRPGLTPSQQQSAAAEVQPQQCWIWERGSQSLFSRRCAPSSRALFICWLDPEPTFLMEQLFPALGRLCCKSSS